MEMKKPIGTLIDMKELTEDEIRYGPALCPGEQMCSHCLQQRDEIAKYVAHLKKELAQLRGSEKKSKKE